MKAVVVATFNQEKALVGAFSVITNLRMDLFEALLLTVLPLLLTSDRHLGRGPTLDTAADVQTRPGSDGWTSLSACRYKYIYGVSTNLSRYLHSIYKYKHQIPPLIYLRRQSANTDPESMESGCQL